MDEDSDSIIILSESKRNDSPKPTKKKTSFHLNNETRESLLSHKIQDYFTKKLHKYEVKIEK